MSMKYIKSLLYLAIIGFGTQALMHILSKEYPIVLRDLVDLFLILAIAFVIPKEE